MAVDTGKYDVATFDIRDSNVRSQMRAHDFHMRAETQTFRVTRRDVDLLCGARILSRCANDPTNIGVLNAVAVDDCDSSDTKMGKLYKGDRTRSA